jgi:hypothetical protein
MAAVCLVQNSRTLCSDYQCVDRQAEEFVSSFENTYTLTEQRVGEASNVTSSSGGVVRVLKCYPGNWQVRLYSET